MSSYPVFRKARADDLDAIACIYDRTHDAEEAGLTTTGWARGIYGIQGIDLVLTEKKL